jgi:methylglutaconyl-CoA hydratase
MYERILTEVDARTGVSRITLNRPERRNALDATLVDELKDALGLAAGDDRVRVVGIAGAGPDFCAGADLREVEEVVEEGVMASLAEAEALGELFLLVRRLEKPVVALVRGRALGGGCGLATACDLVVASGEARFGYPEVSLGFVPAMVMAMLRRAVGERRAFELVALGRTIAADRALEIGLVQRVLAADAFESGASQLLEELGSRSASALALSKRLLYRMDGMDFEAAIRSGAEVNVIARLTDDCREGIRRFLDG